MAEPGARSAGGQAGGPASPRGGGWPVPPVPARSWDLPAAPGANGDTTPHLDLLRGIGEGQRVDAAGGQARLERFGAVSENDLLVLGREGVLRCFRNK